MGGSLWDLPQTWVGAPSRESNFVEFLKECIWLGRMTLES
ncbi:hypothetical protein LINPERPRIM_LOCUS21098 [Linum perenne]